MADIYQLALAKQSGISSAAALRLLEYFQTAENFFNQSEKDLRLLFPNKDKLVNDIITKKVFPDCERELRFAEENQIDILFVTDDNYPYRLKQITDPPTVLFSRGSFDFTQRKMVAIVGSRNATEYGYRVTDAIVEELSGLGACVVSGLALGIDCRSQRDALIANTPTVAVLGSGMNVISPRSNLSLAQDIMARGGSIVTEFFSGTQPLPYNFPVRNRIIAGLSDLVIVIEAAAKSGALITARYANDYNREVMAVPGNLGAPYSEGCNMLIESHRAHILSSLDSISRLMEWERKVESVSENTYPAKLKSEAKKTAVSSAKKLFSFTPKEAKTVKPEPVLQGNEKIVYDILKANGATDLDTLMFKSNIASGVLSTVLLTMELSGIIVSKPGKVYDLA